ncbi:PREDICTED: putative ferric-chelate reductase 1 [Branchiostoma belcheri]|uniref:Ferric-chelate reductase 1 n=1 Tax=Branchiostoma belcheri TaxID=7741 RepID=A0A6P4Z3T1_BRABE|nr:PREDICTED: putative ferric-chelate reductase 1 [Branchiostoma belcheri]
MTVILATVTIVFVLSTGGVDGYSSYVPSSACSDMVPAHKVPGQTSSPPYQLTVDKQTYSPGERINVTIQRTGSETFEGFYIQARPVGQDQPVGTFTAIDDEITLVVDCAPHTQNAVGHRRTNYSLPIVQKTVVSVIWTAPNVTVGDFQFRATVLQNFTTFWVNALESPTISDPTATQGATNVPIATGAATPPSSTISTDGCGVAKGCYGVPDGCSPPNCDLLSTWVTDVTGENVIVEVTGKSDGYVAIGFSRDKTMADDDMYECVRHPTDGNIEVFSSYATGHSRPTRDAANSGVSNVEVAYSNGLLSCRFYRAVRPTARAGAGADQYFDLGNSSYHIFLAVGPTVVQSDGSVQIRRHTSRVYSDQPVDVTSISLVATASAPLFVKLHAGLMMSAWMLTVSIGAVLARFYKPMWPNSTWCGVKIWFAVHRAVMSLTVLLAIAAFVLIFVYKEWTFVTGSNATIHAVMGIIVTSLAVIQPFMSLLRPGPDEPNRVVFNWFHWGFGTTARIMAIIVMFLGLDFPAMDLPDEATYVLASWVAWQALSEVILEQEGLLKCCGQTKATDKPSDDHEEIEMETQKSPSSFDLNPEPQTPKPPGSGFKNGFLAVYLLVLTGFTAAMFSFIALH